MYSGIVAPITVRPHPNADKIQLGTCLGYQVIVGLDTQTGDLGVLFPPDGQLSLEYCEANKLLKKDGGYFDDNRRVRAQKFRGEKSEGLWMPISSLSFLMDVSTLEAGRAITEVCQRYETPNTRKAGAANRTKLRKSNEYFKKHYDTPQWRFFKDQIPDNAVISITEKLHGTSGRYGFVLSETPRRWYHKLLGITPRSTYEYLVGTRNTVLDSAKLAAGTSFYGDEGFRFNAVNGITLHKGEILYFELVGYQHNGVTVTVNGTDETRYAPIMPAQPIKDKELTKQYGKSMQYRYSQAPGTCGLYVYRITRTSEEGIVTELSWSQVKQRCHELGIKHVPEFEQFVTNKDAQDKTFLEQAVEAHTEGPSTLDHSHIREGVVVRVESEQGTQWYKNKSFTFGVLEGYIKDSDDYVDTEEAS